MLKIEQVSLPIKYTDNDILNQICKVLKTTRENIKQFEFLKLSVDARKKPNLKYVASLAFELRNGEENFRNLKFVKKSYALKYKKKSTAKNIVVVGFGPSGMFASLALARMGLKPLVIEQGKMVDERAKDVEEFWETRKLNVFSNVQFGEGGAGTFSDGKLNTNLNNDYCKSVIEELHYFGAPKEIIYKNKPHIGSDKLKQVVKNIREEIKQLGGRFLFSTKLVDIKILAGQVNAVEVIHVETNQKQTIKTDKLLLCVGHSARDVFSLLKTKEVCLKQKPFAMGVRIEQKQSDINLAQYGSEKVDGLGNADYKLVEHLPNGRAIFTFCMCPGGEIVASSSREGEVVTNGMSLFARDKENANSAVLVNINPEDFDSDDVLAGVEYQEKYERLAFKLAGENFNAPAESVGSFVYGKNVKSDITPSYRPQLTFTKIEKCLPKLVSESLKIGLPLLNKKMKGFAKDENLLVAIESRSSCPLTIVRDENFESNIKGLYPVGEGAGYAGGIVSSAQDGIKVAESIYENL